MTRPRVVVCDLETRSPVNLKTHGSDVYAQHPLTRVLCKALVDVWNPERQELWVAPASDEPDDPMFGVQVAEATRGLPFPVYIGHQLPPLWADVCDGRAEPAAHNAPFEIPNMVLLQRYQLPIPDPRRWICTMARAAHCGAPGSLEKCAAALGLRHQKDMRGHQAMLRLCKPRPARKDEDPSKLYWLNDVDDHRTNYIYAMADALAEAEIYRSTPEPSPVETAVIRMDREINMRGIEIDVEAAAGAERIAVAELARLNRECKKVTNGIVGTLNQRNKIISFCSMHGVHLDSLAARDVREALASEDEPETQMDVIDGVVELASAPMPDVVRDLLTLRSEANKASAAKFRAMTARVSADGRIRYALAYHAAYRTGRWAGRGIQPHNDPRDNPPDGVDPEDWFDALASGDRDRFAELLPMVGDKRMSVMQGLKCSVRGMKIPAVGKVLIAPDLAQIEARFLAWAAGQNDIVDTFREYDRLVSIKAPKEQISEHDVYFVTGRKMGMARQQGKVGVLSCGYGSGRFALMLFALNYNMRLTEEQAQEIVTGWRKANPMSVLLWEAEENAAKEAIMNPGRTVYRGHLGWYRVNPESGHLIRRMPLAERYLVYRRARIEPRMTPWGQTRQTITYETNTLSRDDGFVRIGTRGAKLVADLVQGSCRDILAQGMLRIHEHGIPIVFHVHDEPVAEVREDRADAAAKLMVECMTQTPAAAPGLPISSSADILPRYRKT